VRTLVLRAQPACGRTARTLALLGHEAVIAPLFEIAPLASGQLQARGSDAPYGSVVAASPNAFTMLEASRLAGLAGLPAMLVGARSAELAQALGLCPSRPAYRTARELAAGLEAQPPPGPILYLAGRDRRPEIETALRRSGRAFRLVEVYAAGTVAALPAAARAALRRGKIDAVLHYSARSARAYLALADREGLLAQAVQPLQLCLSPAVAQALTVAGAKRVKIAASPEEAQLLALLPAPGAPPAPSRT
jgi:uroporphyrinogen-III synthase